MVTREELIKEKVRDLTITPDTTLGQLVRDFETAGGFTAKKLAEASGIVGSMLSTDGMVKFFSFPACIVSTGLRGLIKDMVKNRMVDIIITTCGTLDHDIARTAENYYNGWFEADDEMLYENGINRLGNVFIPNESYGTVLENILQPMFADMYDKGLRDISTSEMVKEIGLRLKDEESIVYWAARNNIPMYIPGPTDGAVGSQFWTFWQDHKDFNLNLMKDEQALADVVFTADSTGAIMIGGGISKHHTIWWNQFRDGLDEAVYITSAPEWDGSLSGARVREAVSWGKVKPSARFITVEGDATILLPLLMAPHMPAQG